MNQVQISTPGAFGGSLTASTTLTGVTQGNTLLVVAMHGATDGSGPSLSASDSQGTYNIDVASTSGLGVARTVIFRLPNANSGSHTISVVASGGAAANSIGEVIALEMPPCALDQSSVSGGSGTAISVAATAALSGANEFAIAALFHVNISAGGGTYPPTGGPGTYTAIHHSTANQSDSNYQVLSSSSGVGANWGTLTTSGKYTALVGVYKPSTTIVIPSRSLLGVGV